MALRKNNIDQKTSEMKNRNLMKEAFTLYYLIESSGNSLHKERFRDLCQQILDYCNKANPKGDW